MGIVCKIIFIEVKQDIILNFIEVCVCSHCKNNEDAPAFRRQERAIPRYEGTEHCLNIYLFRSEEFHRFAVYKK